MGGGKRELSSAPVVVIDRTLTFLVVGALVRVDTERTQWMHRLLRGRPSAL